MIESQRPAPARTVPARDEAALVQALRGGDERAFRTLVDRLGPAMKRLARTFVSSDAVAEEVVQETWLAVLNGIDRFEQRSSLKTWLFQILANRAKTRAVREARVLPFSAIAAEDERAVDPDRFLGADHDRLAGHWSAPPDGWPEERLVAAETLARVAAAIEQLPPAQQRVIVMRDVEGWDSDEVCAALSLTAGNQRVLLHRARSRVRAALEDYLV